MKHLALIDAETCRFAEAIGRAAPDAPVPTCPDWTADDLLWHLAEVHAFWAEILRSQARTDEESEAAEAAKPARPAARADLLEFLEDATAALVAELAVRRDAEPAWSWFPPDQTVGFTRRMQVHEATMHRVDAELAAGLPSAPIDADVAADGVDHALSVMLAWWGTNPGFALEPVGAPVDLVATDGGRWRVQPGRWRGTGQSGTVYDEPGLTPARDAGAHAGASATVTGTAEELYRWLWGRGPEPDADGGADSLAALHAAVAAGMQ